MKKTRIILDEGSNWNKIVHNSHWMSNLVETNSPV